MEHSNFNIIVDWQLNVNSQRNFEIKGAHAWLLKPRNIKQK